MGDTSRLRHRKLAATISLLFLSAAASAVAEPLKLDPENPHYLMFRGRPVIFVGSSEHYGAVMNVRFDYRRYLNTLHTNGLNVVRLFTGTYHERPGKFGVLPTAGIPDIEIVANTLAPRPENYLAPWPRTAVPGAVDGGHKFDLTRWNPAYFRRLKDFIAEAGRRSIVVEVSFFSNYYLSAIGNRFWEVSPWYSSNNVNGIDNLSGAEALTLKDSRLVAIQDALVKKIVQELNGFDNVYYEICNEPGNDEAILDWQQHMAETIRVAEAEYPFKHLISQEIGFGGRKADERLPQASVIAFHNSEGEAVVLNYDLNIPVIHNESIYDFTDAANRVAAWRFLLSGGAMYLGVDYSFAVGHEDGRFAVPAGGAGGGSPSLRRELRVLRRFMDGLPYMRMAPQPGAVRSLSSPDTHAYVLSQPGQIYAIYVYRGRSDPLKGITVDPSPQQVSLTLALAQGQYVVKWLDPRTGTVMERVRLSGGAAPVVLHSPSYSGDIALIAEIQSHQLPKAVVR